MRAFFNHQELPTDEAVVSWNDQTIQSFHGLSWNSSDPFILGMYARPIYNVALANEFIRQSSDANLGKRNVTGADAAEVKKMKAEARFLRAFNYWVMMDLFGKSTFITENDGVGTFMPNEISRGELFNYIETELKAIEADLGAAKTAEYGRVDQAAAWALLARIYLNAKVYSGTERNTDAITYASKVINAGYSLHNKYNELFMADNHRHTSELIFTANCDGLRTTSFGNTTFFIHAASGDDNADYGANGGWYGYTATSALGNLFPKLADGSLDSNADKRAAHFYTSLRKATPAQMALPTIAFPNGMAVRKYVNLRADGGAVSDATKTYSDIDFPLIRLAEMHLIYAEAVLRGGAGGSQATALQYVNAVRARSNAAPLTACLLYTSPSPRD